MKPCKAIVIIAMLICTVPLNTLAQSDAGRVPLFEGLGITANSPGYRKQSQWAGAGLYQRAGTALRANGHGRPILTRIIYLFTRWRRVIRARGWRQPNGLRIWCPPPAIWSTAKLEGRSELAIRLAQEMAGMVNAETMRLRPLTTLQHYWSTPVYASVRFGK